MNAFYMGRSAFWAGQEAAEGSPEFSFQRQCGFPEAKRGQDHQGHPTAGFYQRFEGGQDFIEFARAVETGEIGENKIIRASFAKIAELGKGTKLGRYFVGEVSGFYFFP